MTGAFSEQVELMRIARGVELWPLIEAAQYAHFMDHDEPRTPGQRDAVTGFEENFVRWVEEWEQRPREVQSSILDDLGRQLETLAGHGMALYGATIEREMETAAGGRVSLPIALLRISEGDAPTETLLVSSRATAPDPQ